MRLGASGDDTRTRWASLPPLAASTPLGQPRAGATVLAVVTAPDGGVFPVVAVQKYGKGRSMVFGGEASWRWRMLADSTDRSHELFWRHAARWLSQSSPDPVSVSVAGQSSRAIRRRWLSTRAIPSRLSRGRGFCLHVDRGRCATDASGPSRRRRTFRGAVCAGREASIHMSTSCVVRRRSGAPIGQFTWAGATGSCRSTTKAAFLRRRAAETGGRYVPVSEASRVVSWLDDSARQAAARERRDVWDRGWVFMTIVLLLCAEWTLRRRWGLR